MRRRVAAACVILLAGCSLSFVAQTEGGPLFQILHVAKPIEREAAEALRKKDYALAIRQYREALRTYKKIKEDFPNLAEMEPRGLDVVLDQGIKDCERIIENIREKGEKKDPFLINLKTPVVLDFKDQDFRDVMMVLSKVTGVSIVVEKTIFSDQGGKIDPKVSIRLDDAIPLEEAIHWLTKLKGCDYELADDFVFVSTPDRIRGRAEDISRR